MHPAPRGVAGMVGPQATATIVSAGIIRSRNGLLLTTVLSFGRSG
jgi:hypothetical protein